MPIKSDDSWLPAQRKLNVFAAIDFASTVSKKADYTCIVVIGIDEGFNIFVLDILRFKTDKISVMQEELTKAFVKWRWIKLRGEATAAQNLVVQQIKEFNRRQGIFYTIEIFRPTAEKLMRIKTNLEPRYAAGAVYHYRGGNCEMLEQELQADRSLHDDIKDALASAVEIATPPTKFHGMKKVDNVIYNTRFGGCA
jgi:phage terminase large subunit-like protein